MSIVQNLSTDQINDSLGAAAEKIIPLTVATQTGNKWEYLYSRVLSFSDGYLLIAPPQAGNMPSPKKFKPGEKLRLNFKLKHFKHITSATVKESVDFQISTSLTLPTLKLCCPLRMQRIQRRAYSRVDLPDHRPATVTFWHGDTESNKPDSRILMPEFTGNVVNLSGGGVRLKTDHRQDRFPIKGDLMGLRLDFDDDNTSIFTNATVRYIDDYSSDQVIVGFQFMGLELTRQGQKNLMTIYGKVAKILKSASRTRHRQPVH